MESKKNARPGRPLVLTHKERRNRILEAAERTFVKSGYGAASMTEIASESSMSKKTLYQFFPDKLSIFVALVLNYDNFSFDSTKEASETGDVFTEIRDLLVGFSQFVFSPRQVAMMRLVIAEAKHSPELAQSFYDNCLDRGVQEAIARRLESKRAAFLAKGFDINLVADMILGATLSTLHMRTLVNALDPEVLRNKLDERIEGMLKLIQAYFP